MIPAALSRPAPLARQLACPKSTQILPTPLPESAGPIHVCHPQITRPAVQEVPLPLT